MNSSKQRDYNVGKPIEGLMEEVESKDVTGKYIKHADYCATDLAATTWQL